jgi:hypothetical protein
MLDAAVDFTAVSSYSAELCGDAATSQEGIAELWRILVSGDGEEFQRQALRIPLEATETEAETLSGYATQASASPDLSVSERSELASEIMTFRHLHYDWDGEDGVAPSKEATSDALAFLELLPLNSTLPRTTVSGDGEVGLYWKTPNAYIDIGFLGDGQIRYYGQVRGRGLTARGPSPYSGLALPRDLLDVIEAI